MDNFQKFYEEYNELKRKRKEEFDDFSTDLLRYDIPEEYYNKVEKATELVYLFYKTKLDNSSFHSTLSYKLNDYHSDNVKLCLLIDIMRCYDGLSHPTSFTTPEGIALMILLDKIIGKRDIDAYEHLKKVSSSTLSLIDILPSISECSDSLGSKYSLILPSFLAKYQPEIELTYRQLIYNLCKTIAEVDCDITEVEQEWLNEIALLNDDDKSNDIDII